MTSKISCIKFIKEDLRQRTWLIAILSTVTFLFQPLMLIIGINEKKNWINRINKEQRKTNIQSKHKY